MLMCRGLPAKFQMCKLRKLDVGTFAVLVGQARTQALHHSARGKVLDSMGRYYETDKNNSKLQTSYIYYIYSLIRQSSYLLTRSASPLMR